MASGSIANPGLTPFNIWMRNLADDDVEAGSDDYDCQLTDPGGTSYSFRYTQPSRTSRYGSECNNVGQTSAFCWMAADGDDDDTNSYQPFLLGPGHHTLKCTATVNHGNEDVGFDGIIVTNDLYFVPNTLINATACNDEHFTTGTCLNLNWGPTQFPPQAEGRCMWRYALAQTPCTNGTCDASGTCEAP